MQKEPSTSYIYQPFGMQDKEAWSKKRIFAIGGLPYPCKIEGITKEEAEKILEIIK